MTENWAPIEGHPPYEVSDLGNVRNPALGRLLKLTEPKRPPKYLLASLHRKNYLVHRLVAAAFCTGHGPVVRHLDGNYLNNQATNLAWGTVTENNLDIIKMGRHNNKTKTHCPSGHPYEGDNLILYRGMRRCRQCSRDNKRKQRLIRAALRTGGER